MIEPRPRSESGTPPLPATPFVGLVPYREEDADFFFGRDEDRKIVTANLRVARLTILYGSSGVGKTSLLEAGVIHDLHEKVLANAAAHPGHARFAVCSFRAWRDDPLPALVESIRLAAVEALGGEELPPWQPGEPLVETLRGWTERVRTLLVVLDQFEDYFLYHPDEDGEGTFAGELPAIVNEPNLRVDFLLSLREDAWAKLDRFKGRIPRLFANYVRVAHLDRDAADKAIEGPVGEWNRRLPPGEQPYSVEPALVEAVISATAAGRLALGDGAAAAAPVAAGADAIEAPFLQLVLERLWRATVDAGSRELTVSRLKALGGAQRIVDNHLRNALGALTRKEKAVAADLFRYLVTRSKTKIAHSVSDLAEWTKRPEPEVSAVLEKLCRGESGRILRAVQSPGEGETTRYELFHDVLAEPILEWRREHERWRARRRSAVVGTALLALVAVFAALGGWALLQRNDARQATSSATSLALAAASNEQLTTHPDASLLMSIEAYRRRPSAQTRSSMISALEAARVYRGEGTLRGHTGVVFSVAFSPDGRILATAGDDATVRLWDVKGHRQLGKPLRGHTDRVRSLSFSPDGRTLASTGYDATVRLWDVRNHEPLGQPFRGRSNASLFGIAFSPDGRTLATAGDDATVRLWDVQRHRQLGQLFRGHTGIVYSVAFSPDGRTLASAGEDGTVRLWNVHSRKQIGQPLRGHGTSSAYKVVFSPDARMLATSSADGTIRLWDVASHWQLGELRGHTGKVYGVAFSADGRTLASAGADQTVRLWDADTHKQLGPPLRGHGSFVFGVDVSRNGLIASASVDQTVRLWDGRRDKQLGHPIRGHTDRVLSVAFSPDGRTLASASTDLRLWDAHNYKQLGQPVGETFFISTAFSPDGQTLASAGGDNTVRLWDVRSHRKVGKPLRGHTDVVNSVAFSPDGHTLASTSVDATVRLWDVNDHKQIGKPLRGHTDNVWNAAFSPDGRTLATASDDDTIRLWEIQSHKQLGKPLRGHGSFVYRVVFSPDGSTLASAGNDGTVRLWDVHSHTPVGQPLRGHTGKVFGVAFSPDGRTLASAGDDATVRLWDVQGQRPLGQPLRDHTGSVYIVAFSPDGRTLASASDDRTVRLWEGILWSSFADLRTEVCDMVVGDLTEAEWAQYAPGLPYHANCAD